MRRMLLLLISSSCYCGMFDDLYDTDDWTYCNGTYFFVILL